MARRPALAWREEMRVWTDMCRNQKSDGRKGGTVLALVLVLVLLLVIVLVLVLLMVLLPFEVRPGRSAPCLPRATIND